MKIKVLNRLLLSFSLSGLAFSQDTDKESGKIVIVGAGMSGLITARELNNHDIPCEIFEAKDHPGGRTHTHYLNTEKTQYFDEGGTTFDKDHKTIIQIACEQGVPLNKRGFGSRAISFVYNRHSQDIQSISKCIENLSYELNTLVKKLKKDTSGSFMTLKEEKWHAKPLKDFIHLDDMEFQFLKTYFEDEAGAAFNQAPVYAAYWLAEDLNEWSTLIKAKKNPFCPKLLIDRMGYNYHVDGGMSVLVNSLEETLKKNNTPIQLNHILTDIKKDERYTLTFKVGDKIKQIEADKVVMTLPFSTLNHVGIDASVGLAEDQKKAIQTLVYGTNSKIGIPIDSIGNIEDEMLYHINLDSKVMGWPGRKAITLMLGGESGATLTQEMAQDIVNNQWNSISTQYPKVTRFGNPVIKNWAQDPFARGSYSAQTTEHDITLTNEAENEDLKGMRHFTRPTKDNTFFFAGEHTRVMSSYIESAAQSGIQAAQLLIKSLRN